MTKQTILKSALLVGLVAISSAATIANMGFYLGGAVGATALTGDNKFTVSRVDPLAGLPLSRFFSVEQSAKNVDGDIFLGYGRRFNCAYLGVELLANFASLKSKKLMDITNQATGDVFTSNAKFAWGGFLNIGYYIQTATKLYLKLGVESRRFNLNFVPGGPTTAPYLGLNSSYRTTAFVPGLGIEVDLNNRFAVRGEYRIAIHPKGKRVSAQDPVITARFSNAQLKPTIQTFNLGLLIKI